ncbi:MAG: transporter substrate-binding domain-containing protein [Thermoflexales bacterium]|nr:transporter substrate-binding domain-containing protein [Thermoflexales bacterium]MDW8352761.1 transporter substrate-binding domain-containing protein [Anaerolineae bacterium]
MRTKRLFACLLTVTVALSACADLPTDLGGLVGVGEIARLAATPAVIVPMSTPTAAPPTISTAALVKQRAKVRVGIRYDAPPLARVNADGDLEGLDVDLAREFARRWLGSTRNVEFVQVTSQSAPGKVKNREVDLALGGLIRTRPSEAVVDFGLTYLYDGEALLVRAGEFTDFASLARRTVTYVDFPSAAALGDAQIASNITVAVQARNSYRAAVNDLLSGATDAVAGRWRRLRATAAGNPSLATAAVLTVEPVAVMLPPNDSDWADLVNLTLTAMIADGTFGELYRKWFGVPPDPIETIAQPVGLQLADLPNAIAPRDGLSAIRQSGVLRVGFDPQAAPFSAANANGQPEGYEVELVREMARRWFGNPAQAQFIPLPADQFPGALNGGTIEVAIGGVRRTGVNEQAMDFSLATFSSAGTPLAIALPENDSALRDLVNFTLQDMWGSGAFTRIFQRWFPDQPVNSITPWPGSEPSVESLLSGA